MSSSRWQQALLLLVGMHCVFGIARLPGKVFGRRLHDMARYRQSGPVQFFLATTHHRGAAAVEWIRQHVADDTAVLWRGDGRGALEFVPALIAPRLLVAESSCPPGAAAAAGRPLATGTIGARTGVLVMEGRGEDLELVVR